MVDEVSPWCEHAKSHERERADGAELAIVHDTVVVRAEGDHAVVDEVSENLPLTPSDAWDFICHRQISSDLVGFHYRR